MNNIYDINFDELFEEKNIFDGPFSKQILISHKQSLKLYMKREIINYDKETLKKYRNIYYKLYNMHYPCSFQPLFITNPSSNNTPLILSSYLQNQSLKNAIQERYINNKLDPTQIYIILYGILIFLQALHSDNYVHGRLKASNILLDSNFNPFVSDPFLYQLNINDNPLNESNKHMIDYIVSIPPEVLKNNSMSNYNDKSDIYSFGIILLQVFTQNINVYSEMTNDPDDLINLIIKGTKPTVPVNDKKLRNIINKCLDHDPKKRPSIKEIIGIIQSIVSDKKQYDTKRFHDFVNDHQDVVIKLNKELIEIKKLADEGDEHMMFKFGQAMLNGENCEKNYNEGRKYIGKAALKGLQEAQIQFNEMNSNLLIKAKIKSSKNYSLKDDPYFTRKKHDVSKIIEKVKQIKKFITEKIIDENKFKNKGFVFTEGAIKRLTKIYYYLEDGVPVLLEGPTGTSKTLSSEIACKLMNYELVRFNLSSDTKSNYLLGRYIGDPKSWAGIRMNIGPFINAYKNGYTLLLDEINLASQECLQFIEEALDSGIISVELPGMPLEEIHMHKNFRLIATQNPNKGSFADKRYDLDNKFLSRFQVINFPSFEEDEYIKIAKGLCKSFKYDASDEFIEDLIKFHMKWSSRDDIKNDIQCFTVREIAATIHALSDKKNSVYDTIMTIYGARYSKDKKNELKELFHSFNSFKSLQPSTFNYPKTFSNCYYNKNLEEALKSILFSFENNRHVILTAKEGYGITQIAKWVAQYYDQKESKNEEKSKNKTKYFCVCTEETKCSDLIGYQKPSEKINSGQELIVWQNGFLTEAIINGKCAVLDSLDEAPSTVAERLNALLDEKYDDKNKMFEIPENPQGEPIKIDPEFRLLCTCRLDNINRMSPAFINRFDVVVLENQLEEINNDQLNVLIELLMKDTPIYIPKNTNKKKDDIIDSDDYDFSLEEENNDSESDRDFSLKKEENPTNLTKKKKLEEYNDEYFDSYGDFSLEEEDNAPQPINMPKQEVSVNDNKEDCKLSSELIDLIMKVFDNTITIYKLSQICKAIKKFSEFFKDASPTISPRTIVEFARDLIINSESPENLQKVPKEIEDYLIAKLSGNKNEDNSFFFKESTSLCSFISKLFACSIINLPVCVYGPTGIGKTASARSFSCMRRNDLMKPIPFRMHSFHVGTRPNNFYGSTTIRNGRVEFINGMLTESLQNGYTFIADEMNLSSSSTMKSLAPALEPCIGEIIYIPGVNEPISIHPDFFFIACQNDVGTIGRNILPSSIASRLKTLHYPIQEEKEISLICKKIANSFYFNDDKKCFSDEDAEKIGKYMIMLNDKQKVIPKWSLRDITKIFKRVYYQDNNPDNYNNIDLIHNILFYTLAPISSKDRKEILETILDLICEIYDNSKREELKDIFNSSPTMEEIKNKKGTFLMKGKIGISTQTLIHFDKYKVNFSCLKSLLDSIFQILLSDPTEPILITGPSGFKTFLSELFLNNPKVIALNQETTVSQLIGTSVFLSIPEAKLFYLDQLCKICNIYDVKKINSLKDKLLKGKLTSDDIKKETKKANKSSFRYSINNLTTKLLRDNESYFEKSILSDMIIEFKPGQILSSIFEGKPIIFKDISNLPTVVLERFNELFSGEHNLTINEDYHNTFTSSNDKELKNFSTNFRAFATCRANTETNLSEAALSRFTVINVPSYDNNELEDVLKCYNIIKNKKLPEDLTDKIIKFTKSAQKHMKDSLSFTQMINILDICSRAKSSKYTENEILGIVLYRIFGGLTTKRYKKIDKIKVIFDEIDLKLPEQIINPAMEIPFKTTKIDGIDGIESNITGLFISSTKNEKTKLKVAYTKSFIDMIDIIHLGISSNVPVIFEGNSGQGKQTAIQLVAQLLGYDVINIIISKSTKIDDLLGKVTIINDEKNNIHIKPVYTKLTKEIEYKSDINNKIFVFHNLNNASPAVLEKLSSLFDRNQNEFSLPDGSTIPKGRINIIGIFNPQNGISNREKLPSSLIFSSIYHIVDNPYKTDISNIINILFKSNEKNPSSKNMIDLSQDATEFFEKYCTTKKFAIQNNAYPPITLHDINKFISFRSVTKEIFSKELIYQMLFGYRFLQYETINNVLKELKLFDMIIQPIFNFDEKEKKVIIKESKRSFGICLEMNPNSNVKIDDIKASIRTLTLAQQQCLLFLACSVLSKRTCIIQGITASGKSHIIRLFAKMLGKELIVYQMNSDTDISFLIGQSKLSTKLSKDDSDEFKEAFEILKDFDELYVFVKETFSDDFNEWKKEHFSELLNKIDIYMENNEHSKERLTIAKSKINRTMSPARRFHKEDSAFIKALENGKWVLIDGIESAPSEIAEKLSSLCGDDMEIDFYECGENYYFSRKNGRKIHDDFHLFITYNPSSKTGTKTIDPLFLNKCVSFTLPALDSTPNSSSHILIGSLLNMKYDPEIAIDIGLRLATAHQYAKKESETDKDSYAGDLQFTARTLTFVLKRFEHKSPINKDMIEDIDKTIYHALNLYYWNSYINKANKKEFKSKMIEKLSEDPQKSNFITDITDVDLRKKYEELLLYLRNIQLWVCKKIDNHFNFTDFIRKCSIVQLADISFIKNHLLDTLDIIRKNKCSVNSEKELLLIENQYMQIQMILKIFNEINKNSDNKDELQSHYSNLPLVDENNILFSYDKFKKPISKLIFLSEVNKESLICLSNPYKLYDSVLITFLEIIVEMSKNPTIKIFNSFIKRIHDNMSYIPKIDDLFPYHLFKENKFHMIVYWMPIFRQLYDNQISFHIVLNKIEYNFEFKGYNNIQPFYVFNTKSFPYLTNESMFQSSNKKEKITLPKNISQDKGLNLDFYKYTKILLKNKKINISQMKKNLNSEKSDQPEAPNHYIFLSKFYHKNIKDSLVSKLWSIMYSFEESKIQLLKSILHPLESTMLDLILHLFSNINEIQIDKLIDITKKLLQIGSENTKLWLILNNEYPSIDKIENIEDEITSLDKEVKDLKALPQISKHIWPPQEYIDCIIKKKDELYKTQIAKLKDKDIKKVRLQLRKLVDDLEGLKINNDEYKYFRKEIIDLITNISQNSPDEDNYNLCNEKVQQFINCLKNTERKFSTFIWPNYHNKSQPVKHKETPNIKLFNNVIWFSQVIDILERICNPNNNSPFDDIFELNKFPGMRNFVHLLMQQMMINKKTQGFNVESDIKDILYSMLNAHFICKTIDDQVQEYIPFLHTIFNDLSKRNEINESEIQWIHEKVNQIEPTLNLVLPKFVPRDFLYLFIEYIGNENIITNGPLIKNIKNCEDKIKKLSDDAKSFINAKITFSDYADNIARSFLGFNFDNKPFPKSHEKLQDELQQRLTEKKYDMISLKLYEKVLSIVKISNIFDQLPQYKFINDDKDFLQKNWTSKKEYIQKFPSLAYFLIKNPKCCSYLQNTFSNQQMNSNFLPFWLFALRIMSSLNCIAIDMDSSTDTGKIISDTISKYIKNNLTQKKNFGTDWLNLILSSLPSEISEPNVNMFYDFFVYLSKDVYIIKIDSLNNHKKEAIEQFTESVCKIVFDKRTETLLKKPFGNLNDATLNFINDPNQSINQKIKKHHKDELDKLVSTVEENSKDDKILIDKINQEIKSLRISIQIANKSRRDEFLESEKNAIKQNIKKYNKSLKKLKSDNGENITEFSRSCLMLIDLYETIKIYDLAIDNNDSLVIYQLKCKKNTNLEFILPKKHWYSFFGNNNYILKHPKNQKNYISQYIKDNCQINAKNNQCEFICITFPSIITNDIGFEQLFSNNIQNKIQSKIPYLVFGKKRINDENLIKEIESIDSFHSEFITETKNDIKNKDIKNVTLSKPQQKQYIKKIEDISQSLTVSFNDGQPCSSVKNDLDEIITIIKQLKNNIQKLKRLLTDCCNLIHPSNITSNQDFFKTSYNLPYPKPSKFITSDISFDSVKNANFLSVPIIFVKEDKKSITCCYEELDCSIGPLIPSLYSEKLVMSFISFIDAPISMEVEIVDNHTNNSISFSTKDCILPGEIPQIEISLPSNTIEEKLEFPILANIIIKSQNLETFDIKCKFDFKLAPLSILVFCNEYNFSYSDDMIYLCAPQIPSDSTVSFVFQSFYVNEKLTIAHQLIDFDDNQAEKPDTEFIQDKNELKLKVKNVKNATKLHCKLNIKFLESIVANILIESVIIPFEFGFDVYDYSRKKFETYPTFYYSSEFIDDNIFVHCRLYASSFFSGLKATIKNNFNDPIKVIECPSELLVKDDTQFVIILKMKNSYKNSISYNVSIKILGKEKNLSLRFEQKTVLNSDYKTNYLISYFGGIPVYGYHWEKNDWINLKSYYNDSTDILFIVSPFDIYNKIKMQRKITIPQFDIYGVFSQVCEIRNGKDNVFYLINDEGKLSEKKGNQYYYNGNINKPFFGILQNNWYPMFNDYYPQYFNKLSKLEFKANNAKFAIKNLNDMPKNSKPASFLSLAQLFANNFSIIKNLPDFIDKFPSSFYHENMDELMELNEQINKANEDDWTFAILKNNIIFFFYTSFKNRYNEIMENKKFIHKIADNLEIQNKRMQCLNEYITTNNLEDFHDPYDYTYKKIKNITKNLDHFNFNLQPTNQFESFLLKENVKEIQPFSKDDIPELMENSKTENSLSEKKIDVKLPEINIPNESDLSGLSIHELNQFYQTCTKATQLFPIYIKNMITNGNSQDISLAKEYFFKLLHIYNPLNTKDYSFISKSVNTFTHEFASMIKKFENAGVKFNSLIDRKIIITERNNQEFIQYPDKLQITIEKDDWKFKEKFQYSLSNYSNVVANPTIVSNSNPSNTRIDLFSIPKTNDDTDTQKPTSVFKGNTDSDKKQTDAELVYTLPSSNNHDLLLETSDESDSSDDNDENDDENNHKQKINVANPNGPKEETTIKSSNFDNLLSSFSEEDGINRAISLMENTDPNDEYENQLYNFHPFDENLYLKPDNDIQESEYPILSLIHQSFIISQEFIKTASTMEIPYSTISVNILIDCNKFISKVNKLYNMMIVCALTDALTTFGIPYSVSVIADSNFKCVIKPFSEGHSVMALQRICDCIMIDRFLADLPDCMRFAIDKMKFPNETRKNRAIFTFTNGLDENLVTKNQWLKIFNDPSLSFGFVFIKSEKLTDTKLSFLEQVWKDFQKNNEGCESFIKVSSIVADNNPINQDGNISDVIKEIVNLFIIVIKGKFPISSNNLSTKNDYKQPVFELPNDFKVTNIYRFKKYVENKYKRLNNIFTKRTDVLNNVKSNMDQLVSKHYNNNLNQILTCEVDNSIRKDFQVFINNHIQKKKKINMSSKEIVFKPNKASRLEPSSSGTVFDISALILYLINPVPEPMIYLEEKGGLIRNYGISVVIDISYSCFNPLSASHSFQTIMSILSALSTVDLPCFDLIIATDSEPIVVCSGVKTLYALNERSSVWNTLFSILENSTANIDRADLASGIHTAFDLRRMRSIQCTNILFVLTDGLYQLSEQSRIVNVVNNCVQSGINCFGVGIGIYPKGIENLFPQVVFAVNPSYTLRGISILCENYSGSLKEMPCINFKFDENGIYNAIKDLINRENEPIFKSLKNELSQIAPTIRAFRYFIHIEDSYKNITPDLANPEGENKELYDKDFLKSQKILIIQLCDDTVCGDPQLNEAYIRRNFYSERNECINEAVKFFGISLEVVQNYEDAIHELTKSKTDFCDYYAAWIICSPHPEKMPDNEKNKNTNKYLIEHFTDVLIQFWKNGGSLVFWADNDPYTFQVNVFLNRVTFENEELCKSGKVSFQIHGDDHPGGSMLNGDRTGNLQQNCLFNKKRQFFHELERSSLSNNLYHIYEGSTLSYVEGIGINEQDKILPFKPFAIDSNGGITSLFYTANLKTNTGDIIIDCGFSKLFYELTTEGTYRYIRNIAGWTARPEVHMIFDRDVKHWEWRPKAVHYDIPNIDRPNYSQHVNNLILRANNYHNTSVIKMNVKKLGGDVDCDLRFSIQWNDLGSWDRNDLDAHCIEPRGFEIMYNKMTSPDTEGTLDVDIVNPQENVAACENIRWKSINTMHDGTYRFFVHQFNFRGGTSGFRAEIEFNNRIYSYDYRKTLQQKEDVDVAYVTLSNRKFTINHILKPLS